MNKYQVGRGKEGKPDKTILDMTKCYYNNIREITKPIIFVPTM